MKIIYNEDWVRVESAFGKVGGDNLLHYWIAKTLCEQGKVVSEKQDKETRTLEIEHPIEKKEFV